MINGALFTFSLAIIILNSQCKEGASDVNVHWQTRSLRLPDSLLKATKSFLPKCPLSGFHTDKQFNSHKNLALNECMRIDLRLSHTVTFYRLLLNTKMREISR